MKQPSSQTLVWTPNQDPRNQARAVSSTSAPNPPATSLTPPGAGKPKVRLIQPATRVIPAPGVQSPVQALPVAKEPPATRIIAQSPVPAPSVIQPAVKPVVPKAQVEKKPAQPQPVSEVKQRRRELDRQCLALNEEHGLSRDYAYLVATGKWTLPDAKYRQRDKDDVKARLEREAVGAAFEKALFDGWIQEQTRLVRLEPRGSAQAQLQEVRRFTFRWSDLPESQPKIRVLALFTCEDYTRWSGVWEVGLKLASDPMEVPGRCADRVKISPFLWVEARECKNRCRVQLLNGVILEGYVCWASLYSVGFAMSLEEGSARCFIPIHGIYSAERLTVGSEASTEAPSE